MKVMSCSRCGKIGHVVSQCTEDIPDAEELWAEIEAKIKAASATAPSEWQRDEFGWYLPNVNSEISDHKSFADGEFCFNCGEFGHTSDSCQFPDRRELQKQFGNCTDMSASARGQRAMIIRKLNSLGKDETSIVSDEP